MRVLVGRRHVNILLVRTRIASAHTLLTIFSTQLLFLISNYETIARWKTIGSNDNIFIRGDLKGRKNVEVGVSTTKMKMFEKLDQIYR